MNQQTIIYNNEFAKNCNINNCLPDTEKSINK